MPAELREHLRYPEDLFRVQTDVYSKYQLDPERFFDREGAWSVAQAPTSTRGSDRRRTPGDGPSTSSRREQASESSASRFIPYYTLFADPAREGDRLRDAPSVRAVLARRPAHRAAGVHDRVERTGHLRAARRLRRARSARRGPRAVANAIESEPRSPSRSPCRPGGGNRVRFGDLQLVPIGDGLLWVRPFYAAVPQLGPNTTVTESRFVIVSYNGRSAYGSSLSEALGKLFPGFDADLGDGRRRQGTDEPAGRTTPPPETGEPSATTRPSCSPQADELFAEADADLATATSASTRRRSTRPRRSSTRRSSCSSRRRRRLSPTPLERFGCHDDTGSPKTADQRALRSLGQAGEVLAEGDLVAGLLVGEAYLAVAQLVDGAASAPSPDGRASRASMS